MSSFPNACSSHCTHGSKVTTTVAAALANKHRYPRNGGWDGHWTVRLEALLRAGRAVGDDVHEITDAVHFAGGPARWESVRDRMLELWPYERVVGDEE